MVKLHYIMNVKENLAKNLIRYRKLFNITQAELAEKLNYSDKAVSKWERAEAVPDLEILKQIADFYCTTIDNLLAEPKEEEKPKVKKYIKTKRLIISLLAFGLVWLIAIFAFALLGIFLPSSKNLWLIFIYSIPISTIVFLIFSAIWGKNLITCICISALIWSILLSIFLSLRFLLTNPPAKLWLIFLIGIPAQILTILWTSYISLNLIGKILNKK